MTPGATHLPQYPGGRISALSVWKVCERLPTLFLQNLKGDDEEGDVQHQYHVKEHAVEYTIQANKKCRCQSIIGPWYPEGIMPPGAIHLPQLPGEMCSPGHQC